MARKVLVDLDFQSIAKATNLAAPSASSDAATKGYVDSAVEGLAWKDSVRVSTQGNINLSAPGATIDGVTLTALDRVLVRNQTTQADNGLYVFNGAAVAMTRALDAITFNGLVNAVTTVNEGTNAGSSWRQTTVSGTLGTTAIIWVSFGVTAPPASTVVAGVARLATQAEVNAGTDATIIVTPQTLTNWTGRILKYAVNIGDGSATSYTVTHNFNTRDVFVRVFPNSGNYDDVEVDVQRTGVNTVAVVFASAPAINAYRVLVIG